MYTKDIEPKILPYKVRAYIKAYVGLDETGIFFCDSKGNKYFMGKEVQSEKKVEDDSVNKSLGEYDATNGLECCITPEPLKEEIDKSNYEMAVLKIVVPKGVKYRQACIVPKWHQFFATEVLVDSFKPVKLMYLNRPARVYQDRINRFLQDRWMKYFK